MKIKNISSVVEQNLCLSCAACSVVCPTQSIEMKFKKGLFIPAVNKSCNYCGQCLNVCPGHQVNYHSLYQDGPFPQNILIGNIEECYTVFAKDEKIRLNGTSGGVLTCFVQELISKNYFDKACILNFKSFQGLQATLSFTNNLTTISEAAKSKYIPVSLQNVLQEIQQNPEMRYIIVGIPCQFYAIKYFLQQKKIDDSKILFLGLFCDMTLNYNIYNYFKYKYANGKDIKEFDFRSKQNNGWPGDVRIVTDKDNLFIERTVRISLKPYFQLNRCRFCFDKLNQLSDISFGDCYIKDKNSYQGISNIIIRTNFGRKNFDLVKSKLDYCQVDKNDIIQSQNLFLKQRNLSRAQYLYPNMYPDIAKVMFPLLNWGGEEDKAREQMGLGSRCSGYWGFRIFEFSLTRQKKDHKNKNKMNKTKEMKSPALNFTIDNTNKVNKGAELMTAAIIQKVKQFYPHGNIGINPNTNWSREKSAFYGLLKVQKLSKGKKYSNAYRQLGFLNQSDINVVLDAGGFQFGDQWINLYSKERNIALENYYRSLKEQNASIIFLPQAFGPFSFPLSIDRISIAHQYADLIYAREPVSYEHLVNLFPDSAKIKLSPDFTQLCKPKLFWTGLIPDKIGIIIIPNKKMITHVDSTISGLYIDFMTKICQYLIDRGEKIFLLNHESIGDLDIINQINAKLSQPSTVISDLNALEIKALIGKMKLVVSSRFHGVVSGLSQGIPTFTTSWSHKYETLLSDYGVPDNLLDIEKIDLALEKISAVLNNKSSYYLPREIKF